MKPLEFIGTAHKDLRAFPKTVQKKIGTDLMYVQFGEMPVSAKPMKGKHLRGVMEIIRSYDTDTYRTVYLAKIGGTVVVLHCFQKKAKRGKKTPQKDIDLIRRRLCQARENYERR